MNTGYIIFCYIVGQEKSMKILKKEFNRRRIYIAWLIFFITSFVATIIALFRNIILTFTVGYGERMVSSSDQLSVIENISGILSTFMAPSLIALFIGRKTGQKFSIIVIVVYMILCTLS